MALVTQIKKASKSRHTIHKPTTCDYSIFVGDELLTTPNPAPAGDIALLQKLGLTMVTDK